MAKWPVEGYILLIRPIADKVPDNLSITCVASARCIVPDTPLLEESYKLGLIRDQNSMLQAHFDGFSFADINKF